MYLYNIIFLQKSLKNTTQEGVTGTVCVFHTLSKDLYVMAPDTNNICILGEIRKIIFGLSLLLLSGAWHFADRKVTDQSLLYQIC